MSLNIALIDKSEVIKKMIAHSLHYYSAEVHRFETLDDFQLKKNHIKPDVLIIDWELKKGDSEPLAVSAKKDISDIPIIAIYRDEQDKDVKQFPHTVKKPIDPSLLRKVVSGIVHKAKDSKIHEFLKYPENEKETLKKNSMADVSSVKKKEETKKIELPTLDLETIKKDSQSSEKKEEKSEHLFIDREKVDIDELSLGDFGPLPVTDEAVEEDSKDDKTPISIKKEGSRATNFSEYKNSLEFETLVENTLKSFAQDLSKKILEKEHAEFIKQSFENFKKTEEFEKFFSSMLMKTSFQELFVKELEKFIKQELPKIAKEAVEAQIKTLLKTVD